MKTLITKSDGTSTKSKVHALQFLDKNGISKNCLIEENGQFFYEDSAPLSNSLPKGARKLENSPASQSGEGENNCRSQEPPTPANAGTSPLKGADEYSPVT